MNLETRPRHSIVFRVFVPIALVLCAVIGGYRFVREFPFRRPPADAVVDPENTLINSIGMKLLQIPPGEFLMGSSAADAEPADQPQHRVRITAPYWIGMYEVTEQEYKSVTGIDPFTKTGRRGSETGYPMTMVSWTDAVEYCRMLSDLPEERSAGRVYRLPTEAEWEYACRAGTTTAFNAGDSLTTEQAHFDATKTSGPGVVGSHTPNAFGLYDAHGNVHEWCADWYSEDYYSKSATDDPAGADQGTHRVTRGGSWWSTGTPHWHGSASRHYHFAPDFSGDTVGFRVVLQQSPK